jgi:hypothetical protein
VVELVANPCLENLHFFGRQYFLQNMRPESAERHRKKTGDSSQEYKPSGIHLGSCFA